MPRFAGTRLASFAPCVRRNRRRSQVSRMMFSRAYTYHLIFKKTSPCKRWRRGTPAGGGKCRLNFLYSCPLVVRQAHPELVEGCGTHFLTLSKVKKQIFDAR